MKKITIFYWVLTSLICFMMTGSAIPNIMSDAMSVQGMHVELGYPKYFIPFIGWAKLLGVIALLLPIVPPRLKEWAYAGLAFDLTGALFSIASIGKPDWPFLFIPLALLAGSYFLYHKRRAMKQDAVSMSKRQLAVSAA
ncbi:DoxX family protein [Flaviaesturariibacter flavus]|uniref:DoxX family protein n=1 Tax=Flaviaesturariibacter flavus TaxID=2502780 RepID=A0A4R1BMA4_9BACT|nr:DoxX family protein [Flaviaesturariibacter flavus]TCJ18611.1 DoxX family protein [Flaviaesturariibacter flavus]